METKIPRAPVPVNRGAGGRKFIKGYCRPKIYPESLQHTHSLSYMEGGLLPSCPTEKSHFIKTDYSQV